MNTDDFLKTIREWDIEFLANITNIENPLSIDLGKITDEDIHRDEDIVPETLFERISVFNQVLDDRWACVEFRYDRHHYCVWVAARGDQSIFIPYTRDPSNGIWSPSPIYVVSDSNDMRFKRTSPKIEPELPLTDDSRRVVVSLTMIPVALASEKVTN